ncbi:uncharacterized protein BXZ73DRAFT_39181 [Epithele typhae]|uniref:uncharacterized protein n=1 Tax=Epithele typhae TaxID=378194 RepID=UPI00200794EC|nr:uncharacterized protein BXZ73DRAFT_51554 [Epithele typhae]XP_047882923.1 uncharacterized protein BXZ73DRAFT_39181 [Epithele typhae]KAH9921931.1 hypothetical protein BXZ73DRAFT_51554 [Epithele typhae]KAH9944566.1 hypothetical protein BXZ73DRAFT_39181 [Epithele typhae]
MLYDPDTANHLKPWLIRTLEPICDAEPGALADYILALLKHNAPEPELRKELETQLEEFLENGASPVPAFVDTLFTALRSKSYLPYSAVPSSSDRPAPSTSADGGIPIPLDGLFGPSSQPSDRGRKRGIDGTDYDSHGPSKGARLNHDGQSSRYGRGDGRSAWSGRGERGGRMNVSGRADFMDGGMAGMEMNTGMNGMGMNGRNGQSYRPPDQRRGICRDYHNSGYCARGAFCKYSHGDDAVIPGQLFPLGGGMPFMGMMGPGGMPFPMGNAAGATYDPHERMDMRPMNGMGAGRGQNPRPAVLPRTEQSDAPMGRNPGELPVIQDLTPQVPIQDVQPHINGDGPGRPMEQLQSNGAVPSPQIPATDGNTSNRPLPANGRGGMAGRGRGRGSFGGDAQSFRPERRNDKTLVVEKIPEDKLSLGAVNDWFSKFGTVTNVAVDAPSSKALVSFNTHEEAYKAWKSEEAVFGNRFVKVFWHRPMEGHGQAGQRMLAASAPIVAQRTGPTAESASVPQPPAPAPSVARSTSNMSSAAAALAAKQKLIEQQIEEQKTLMAKLSSATAEEKKPIMARLRELNKEMKPSATSAQSPPPPASSSTPRKASTPHVDERQRAELERLDKELETHHSENGTPGAEGEEESTEELKAKLEKLKAEAASLGIPVSEPAAAPYGGTSYRPYRGRGRGARGSYYRGAIRGGPPRTSMKLDNRPKKLLVKGAPVESLQAVRDWYETTGQVDAVDALDGGNILVSFRTRAAAEQGFAKGSQIATVGGVQLSWHAGPSGPSKTSTVPVSASAATLADADSRVYGREAAEGVPEDVNEDSAMHAPDDIEVGGWGVDDDGFGMM